MLQSRRRTLVTARMLGEGAREFFADGRAPCVVAFHGFGGTAAELRPLLDRVAAAGFAVDAACLPGHGGRVEELQEMTYADWLHACRRRVETASARYGAVILLGFSLGSLLAMEIAAETNGVAGPAAGLVVLGNAVTLRPHSSLPLGLVDRLGLPLPDLYLLKPRAGDLVDPSGLPGLVSYDRHPLRSALEVYRAGVRVRALVPRIVCPTLVLHGRRDLVCRWTNAPWVADHVAAPDVTVRIFERSGHVLACDGERDEVAREVTAFLKRLREKTRIAGEQESLRKQATKSA